MKAVAVFAVCGLCVCAASVSFGQTTQPRKQDPEQEQAPPEDSPQPLGKARRLYRALFGGANTGSAARDDPELQRFGVRGVQSRRGGRGGAGTRRALHEFRRGSWTTGGTVPAWRLRRRAVASLRYYTQHLGVPGCRLSRWRGRARPESPLKRRCSSAKRVKYASGRPAEPVRRIPSRRSWVIRCHRTAISR